MQDALRSEERKRIFFLADTLTPYERDYHLKAVIPAIDQDGQGLASQFPTLSPRFGLSQHAHRQFCFIPGSCLPSQFGQVMVE
jgi:hypothetical protein